MNHFLFVNLKSEIFRVAYRPKYSLLLYMCYVGLYSFILFSPFTETLQMRDVALCELMFYTILQFSQQAAYYLAFIFT